MTVNDNHILGVKVLDEEGTFRHAGCDNCANGLGNDVYRSQLNFQTKEGRWDYYCIDLCHICLCAYFNGDDLDEECKDKYKI